MRQQPVVVAHRFLCRPYTVKQDVKKELVAPFFVSGFLLNLCFMPISIEFVRDLSIKELAFRDRCICQVIVFFREGGGCESINQTGVGLDRSSEIQL